MSEWQRREGGYMRRDGEWFIQRGAPMTPRGTAWLIYRRVTGSKRVGEGTWTFYDEATGNPLWGVDSEGYPDTVHVEGYDPTTTDLYAHDYDAGALAEAKYAVEVIETRERAV